MTLIVGAERLRTEQRAALSAVERKIRERTAFEEAAAEIFAQCALLYTAGDDRRRKGPIFSVSDEALTGDALRERLRTARDFVNGSDPASTDPFQANIVGYFLGQLVWIDKVGMVKDFVDGEAGADPVRELCASGAIASPKALRPLIDALLDADIAPQPRS